MKKLLGVLLALTIAVSVFAGLTLLSVSAVESQTGVVDGQYFFDDFEGNSNKNFSVQTDGTVSVASKASGAPTRNGSEYSLKYSGGTQTYSSPAVTIDITKKIVDGAGVYALSTWIYFEQIPGAQSSGAPATITAIFRGTNGIIGSSGYYTFPSQAKSIVQGKWVYLSWFCELTAEQAADPKLQIMFDGMGKNSVVYLDDYSFAKVTEDFIGVYSYNKPSDPYMGAGTDAFTGANLPANEGKVSFTLYNFNDEDASTEIQLRAKDWAKKKDSGKVTIPAGASTTVTIDVSAVEGGYLADDFWIIYMNNAAGTQVTTDDYTFGIALKGFTGIQMFQKTVNINKEIVAVLDGTVSITGDDAKGSTWHKFGGAKIFGAEDTLRATAKEGCTFEGWYQGETCIGTEATLTLDKTSIVQAVAESSYTAKFSGNVQTVTLGDGTLENSDKGWVAFASGNGGVLTRVDGGANGTAKAMQFVAGKGSSYAALGFDVGPAIIEDAENNYAGGGAGLYKLTFYAKLGETSVVDTGAIKIFLNSQYHKSADDLAKAFGGASKDYVATYTAYTDKIEINKTWQKFEVNVEISEKYIEQILWLYQEKNIKNAYELLIRFDASEGLYSEGANQNPYLIDELTFEKVKEGTEPTPVPEEPKEPVAVKWTFDKDYSGEAFFCSANATGFITDADVKNGKVAKDITIYNTGSEDIQVWFSASVLHKGNPNSWEAIKNTEKTVIPAGKSLLIHYECDAKVTINTKGLEAEYTYDQFFPRLDVSNKDGGALKAGTEFIISGIGVAYLEKLDTNAKDFVTRSLVYELPTSGGSNNGDVLPIALLAVTVIASAVLIVVAKKKKEQN